MAIDIYRPDAPGKFPALLALSPYGKTLQTFQTPPQPFGKSCFEASIESGDPYFYAPRGYVYVIGDLRGTGDSEGEYVGLFSNHEGQDGADIVEWLAQQPWCDGNVGMAGICYFASMHLHVAAEQPPHLKCIAPWEIFGDDLYNHGEYEGGVFNIFFYGLYTGTYPARCGYAIKNVKSAMIKNTPKAELDKLVAKAYADPDLKQYPYLSHLLKYPEKNPILFDFMLNKLDGPYYRERSVSERLDMIKVPTYVGGPLFSFFSQPQINVFNRVDVPKKMFLYTDMGTRPWRAHHDELLRWYDYWLKGIETGIMDEAPVRYHTTVAEKWSTAQEWPPEDTQWTDFYFNSLGGLSPEPDYHNDEPDAFVQQPLYVTEESARRLREQAPVPGPPGHRPAAHHLLRVDRPTGHEVQGRSARGRLSRYLSSGIGLAEGFSSRARRRQDHSLGDRPRPHKRGTGDSGRDQRIHGATSSHVAPVPRRQADQGGDLQHRHTDRHRDLRRHVARLQQRDDAAQDLSGRLPSLQGFAAGHPARHGASGVLM
ncbi:MAG: hypothetical protein A2133_05295 [Actinobacteria bacterium RBG_16_64_13]|nr:MAG: hypothetical protein A2133_05295 [Actinobacteria bacterium RBG_16_64_13]